MTFPGADSRRAEGGARSASPVASSRPSSDGLRSAALRLVHLGADRVEPSDVRFVVLTNTLALAVVGLCAFFFWPLSFVLHDTVSQKWLLPAALAASTPIWLNRQGFQGAAGASLAAVTLIGPTMFVIALGPGLHYLFLAHAILPFLMFAPRHSWIMVLTVFLGLAMFFVLGIVSHAPSIVLWADPSPTYVILGGLILVLVTGGYYSRRVTLRAEALLREERRKSEALLLNVLPESIAARLKEQHGAIADSFHEATVLFADVAGFTVMSSKLAAEEVVGMLGRVFTEFDQLAEKHGLEKIKTIGDAYMVAGGLPEPRADHAEAVAEMAIGMVEALGSLKTPTGDPLNLRIGIHTGPVVAGVIGRKKFSYDLWGDTVNTASRMESHGAVGKIHVTQAIYEKLSGRFVFEDRGPVSVKGKGEMVTYFLTGRRSPVA